MALVSVPTLIAVASCHARPAHRRAQRVTWAPHLQADVRFFVGRSATAQAADATRLDVDDSYDGLAQKTVAMARWALAHGYELVLKANDDVLLFPGRLRLPPPEVDYAGWAQDGGTWIQGHAYWMRRRALEIIAGQAMPAVLPPPVQVEDRWVGAVLRAAGVPTWNDPGIGCVRRPQGGQRFDLAAMLRATDRFYAAAEFAPEELVALYDAVHHGTCWRRGWGEGGGGEDGDADDRNGATR